MKILVDLSPNNKGSQRARQGLLPELEVARKAAGMIVDYVLPGDFTDVPEVEGRIARVPVRRRGVDLYNEELLIPWLSRRYDLLFTYRESLCLPRRRPWKLVVQIHEHPLARYAPQPSLTDSLMDGLRRWRAGQVYEQADMLLFSSEWTRDDFARLERRQLPPDCVVPLAGWPDWEAEAARPVGAEPYVVMMASDDRRDSLAWGLQAWQAASFPPSWHLVVIGRLPSGSSLPDQAKTTGWVSDHQLRQCLARAGAYLHIGQVEGFGIAVVEALQLGVPVVAPAGSALYEVLAGGGGILAASPEEAGQALRMVVAEPRFREAAFAAGGRYRWQYNAERLIKIFAAVGSDDSAHGFRRSREW
jgi:glycosyltransferase involved in cell wall biosynthesis